MRDFSHRTKWGSRRIAAVDLVCEIRRVVVKSWLDTGARRTLATGCREDLFSHTVSVRYGDYIAGQVAMTALLSTVGLWSLSGESKIRPCRIRRNLNSEQRPIPHHSWTDGPVAGASAAVAGLPKLSRPSPFRQFSANSGNCCG
jgi:hypothetical protein